MTARLSILVVLFVGVACSAPGPVTPRQDAVVSGDETAKNAGEAARAAEESDNTGILVASSKGDPDRESESDPDESAASTADPTTANPTTTLSLEMEGGSPIVNGEPADLQTVASLVEEAVASDPNVFVIVIRDSESGPRATEEVMEAARSAGATHVEERQALDVDD